MLAYSPDLQAYRTDRFTGWVRQPADIGPGDLLEHVAVVREARTDSRGRGGGRARGSAEDDGLSTPALLAIILGGAALAALAGFAFAQAHTGGARVDALTRER